MEDTATPADVRFFHVLQGADSGTSVVPATLLTGTCSTGMFACVGKRQEVEVHQYRSGGIKGRNCSRDWTCIHVRYSVSKLNGNEDHTLLMYILLPPRIILSLEKTHRFSPWHSHRVLTCRVFPH